MCGIAGALSSRPIDSNVIKAMSSSLSHRGPDSEGCWSSPDGKVAIGHQRLAVIELSAAGHQPMHSACDRYCISYNGEIYNAIEIREKLEKSGKKFRGSSDTEVILEACAVYGVEQAVMQFTGMFAFALWDKQSKSLFLVRDRLGIKPLYWGCFDSLFLFSSELKALRKHPGWPVELNRSALSDYVRLGYIPAPSSIYTGIFKLEPGTVLKYRQGTRPEINTYWSIASAVHNGIANRYECTDLEAIDTTEKLLSDAVQRRMVSDVSLGAFLSGGIDSSTVAAIMQRSSARPVKTFSIGFHETGYNEAEDAARIAEHLGTEHTEFYVTPADAMEPIRMLPGMYDEPFADSSQIPTYLISMLTRKHVTVALSGDGGDEVFAGYNRYNLANNLIHKLDWLTPPGKILLRSIIHAMPPRYWNGLLRYLPGFRSMPLAGDKLYKLADLLNLGKDRIYERLTCQWSREDTVINDSLSGNQLYSAEKGDIKFESLVEEMQYRDFNSYLPDDILTKVDRASMAVSLEVRVPLLDHRLVEHAWRLPTSMKIRNGRGKWVLRRVLDRYVPERLIDRPKMGFGVPLDSWLRGPLREWADTLLQEDRLRQQGLFNPVLIRDRWRQHLSGERNWQYPIWNMLMFQAWHDEWMTDKASGG